MQNEIQQVGIDGYCSQSNQAAYSAWYELLPNPPVVLDNSISIMAGDSIYVSVSHYAANQTSILTIRNVNRNQSVVVVYASDGVPEYSECVVERPTLTFFPNSVQQTPQYSKLLNFGQISMNCNLSTGLLGMVLHPLRLIMVNREGQVIASVAGTADQFTVTWQGSGD